MRKTLSESVKTSSYSGAGIVSYCLVFIFLLAYAPSSLADGLPGPIPKIASVTGSGEIQQSVVTGKVVDKDGYPIEGTTVVVKGTTNGVVTNVSGEYRITDVPPGATLVYSFIGMVTQEIQVAGQNVIDVVLQEAVLDVDAVVVIGYGSQKKESVVGAISQTTSKEIERTGNVPDFAQALTGQLPGIITVVSSGEPGGIRRGESVTSIYIRGQNTWNGGQPLILVDGLERDINNLDASEVESISVLKDASATAVFGVKGANGVIMITTKRGTAGKPQLSFSYSTTGKMVSKLPQVMDSYSALMVRNESIERELPLSSTSWTDYKPFEIVQRYKLPQTPEYSVIYPNVNWEEALFKDVGFSHHASLNVQGGTDFVNYFGSLSYFHEGDMFQEYDNNKGYEPKADFTRYNFRSNFDFKLTKTTKLVVNLSGIFGQKNSSYVGEGGGGTGDQTWMSAVYVLAPDLFLPIYDDGRWGYSQIISNYTANPAAVFYNCGVRENRVVNLNTDISLQQNLDFITKGLSIKGSFFYDNSVQSEGGIYDSFSHSADLPSSTVPVKVINPDLYTGPDQDPAEYTQNLPVSDSYTKFDWYPAPWYIKNEVIGDSWLAGGIPVGRRMMYQFQLNYGRQFKLHNVGAMGLMKREEYAMGNMFKNYREDWVFRVTYDYDSRYLFEANGAYNGSEQFGPGYRFHFFPSVAVGWNIAREKFFNIDWMNNLKVRYSIGMVGDDKVSGRWLYDTQYGYGGNIYFGNYLSAGKSPYTWYWESTIGNPDIHWENALKTNLGLELAFLDNMFIFTGDYFTEDRTDILLSGGQRSIPPYFGTTPPSANLGHVKSSGYELEFKVNKRFNIGVSLWSNISFSHTDNTILDKDEPELLPAYLKDQGYPIGQVRSQIRTGFINNWDDVFASTPYETNDQNKMPGFYNILDYSADGVIKSSDDVVPTGYSRIPQNTYNLSFGGGYKGLNFMLQFYAVNNVTRVLPLYNYLSMTNLVFEYVEDYWSKDNQDASSFLPTWKLSGQNLGDFYVEDGSYIRLKTAELSYTFSEGWINSAGVSSMKIYINGTNLLFWSKMLDDREASFSGPSDQLGTYPTVKRINLGVNITF
jgi:TonB-linked SusC/RagA family outer membrane protein